MKTRSEEHEQKIMSDGLVIIPNKAFDNPSRWIAE
jgi:hypothetical protein